MSVACKHTIDVPFHIKVFGIGYVFYFGLFSHDY